MEIINILNPPIPIVETREPTQEEIQRFGFRCVVTGIDVPIGLITTAYDLAVAIIKHDIEANTVDRVILENSTYKKYQAKKTPQVLLDYQKTNNKQLQNDVNSAVLTNGMNLALGQFLFHGGNLTHLNGSATLGTLSTTLHPSVAISNALHKSKAFNDVLLILNILTIKNSNIKGFIFNNRTSMSHEREILLQQGLRLNFVSEAHIKDLDACNGQFDRKMIPVKIMTYEVYL